MQNAPLKKKTAKPGSQREKMQRRNWAEELGVPQFMLRLARQRHMKIFEELALPRYRHD